MDPCHKGHLAGLSVLVMAPVGNGNVSASYVMCVRVVGNHPFCTLGLGKNWWLKQMVGFLICDGHLCCLVMLFHASRSSHVNVSTMDHSQCKPWLLLMFPGSLSSLSMVVCTNDGSQIQATGRETPQLSVDHCGYFMYVLWRGPRTVI